MKKFILFAALLGFSSLAFADLTTKLPNGLGVGKESASDYVVVTKTAYVYVPIELAAVKQGDFYTIPASTSSASLVYWGAVTGLTNTSALTVPRVDAMSFGVKVIVPSNYRSGGVLEALCHFHATTDGAKAMTITANVYLNSPASATITTKVAGTAVNPSVSCGTQFIWTALTNAATYLPGDVASYYVQVDGTTVRLEIVALRWKYRPWGVLNGVQSKLPYQPFEILAAILGRDRLDYGI